MSRKIKEMSFDIEDENGKAETFPVKVKELTVRQVKRLLFSATSTLNAKADEKVKSDVEEEKKEESPENKEVLTVENQEDINVMDSIFDIFGKEFKELFELSVSGIGWDRIEDFTPSQVEELYDGFKEVNKVFFRVAQSMGITEGVAKVLSSLKQDLLEGFVNSFNTDTTTTTP